jgi:hypothetical protein
MASLDLNKGSAPLGETEQAEEVSTRSSIEAEDARAADDGKVIRGKDGWLFLARDSNDVIAQQTGEKPLDPTTLSFWKLLLEHRISWMDRHGIAYFFLVAPNAHAVYPEMLPDGIKVTDRRPIYQLMEYLEAQGSFAKVIYPIEELLAEKPRTQVYTKTDNHWNAVGAYCAYARLAEEMRGIVPIRILPRDRAQFYLTVEPSGLGYKVDPPAESVLLSTDIVHRRARVVYDNQIYMGGSIIATEREDAARTTCLICGDSFTYRMLHWLSGSFRRMVFAHNPSIDFELIYEEKPDVVVSIMSEHFLTGVPWDLPPKSTRERERYKREQGQMRRAVSG